MNKKDNKQHNSKVKIKESLAHTIIDDDVLVVNDWSELGDLVSAEEFCKRLDDILNGQ